MSAHQNNVVRLTPMRRDLEKRLSELRASGPKNPHPHDASGKPIIPKPSSLDLSDVYGRLAEHFRTRPIDVKALAPTQADVIAAGGYKMR
jgi:hypothetical protein